MASRDAVTSERYVRSLRTRLSILFSPLRLTLFICSLAWRLGPNYYLTQRQGPTWLGPVSVVPITAFAIWTVVTDVHRRSARG